MCPPPLLPPNISSSDELLPVCYHVAPPCYHHHAIMQLHQPQVAHMLALEPPRSSSHHTIIYKRVVVIFVAAAAEITQNRTAAARPGCTKLQREERSLFTAINASCSHLQLPQARPGRAETAAAVPGGLGVLRPNANSRKTPSGRSRHARRDSTHRCLKARDLPGARGPPGSTRSDCRELKRRRRKGYNR